MKPQECRKTRELLGLPQRRVAYALDIDQSAFSRFESGLHTLPPKLLEKLACYLHSNCA
jgi:transcriptional regulator with XRE-family HTH domain